MAEQPANAWEQIEAYLERACVEEGVPEWPVALAARPPGYLSAASMWWTDAEVNNGGFSQYFLNDTNAMVWSAIAGYERIGAARMADILRSAVFVCREDCPGLLRAPVPDGAFHGFQPMARDFGSLDQLYYDELSRLPVAVGIENDGYLFGTVEHYWKTVPEDFQHTVRDTPGNRPAE